MSHYRIQPSTAEPGRWLVVHPFPGLPGVWTTDEDCPSQAAAERALAHLQHARDRLEAQWAQAWAARDHLGRSGEVHP